MAEALEKDFVKQSAMTGKNLANSRDIILKNLAAYGMVFQDREDILTALAADDTASLERIMVAEYKKLHGADPTVRTVEVTDARGMVVMRGHNPGTRGDDKSKVAMIAKALSGETAIGTHVSITTNEINIDAIYPLRYGGGIIGTLKIGAYLRQEMAEYFKDIVGSEIVLFANGQMNASTIDGAEKLSLDDGIMALLEKEKSYNGIQEIDKKKYNVSFVPLFDIKDEVIGAIGGYIARDGITADLSRMLYQLFAASLFSAVLGIGAVLMFARFFINPINKMIGMFSSVAEGDLSATMDRKMLGRDDEIGDLANAFDKMIDNLRALVLRIMDNADKSAVSAEKLSSSSQQVNASVEQVSAAIQEIASGAEQLSKSAITAMEKSAKTQERVAEGSKTTSIVKNKIGSMSDTTRTSAVKVRSLGDKSKQIGNIISTINDISEQTNLLALNAAIEAARAGEAGRGFAVVADEVRKLAEESHNAADTINELVKNIQEEINDSVQSIDQNITQVEFGTGAVNEALAAFDVIPGLVRDVNNSMTEIGSVAEQNASGAQQVSASVQQVTSVMQQVAGTAQQLAAGSNELREMVRRFKLDKGPADQA
jgi:methyl-accepting chemotaxis protein